MLQPWLSWLVSRGFGLCLGWYSWWLLHRRSPRASLTPSFSAVVVPWDVSILGAICERNATPCNHVQKPECQTELDCKLVRRGIFGQSWSKPEPTFSHWHWTLPGTDKKPSWLPVRSKSVCLNLHANIYFIFLGGYSSHRYIWNLISAPWCNGITQYNTKSDKKTNENWFWPGWLWHNDSMRCPTDQAGALVPAVIANRKAPKLFEEEAWFYLLVITNA